MSVSLPVDGFLLTRQMTEGAEGIDLHLWFYTAEGPLCVRQLGQEGIFFVESPHWDLADKVLADIPHRKRSLALQSFSHVPVTGYYFRSVRMLRQAAQRLKDAGIEALESDVRTVDRYLMERFITGPVSIAATDRPLQGQVLEHASLRPADVVPSFRVVSFDIETAYDRNELFSIAVYAGADQQQVFLRGEPEEIVHARFFADERELLRGFITWLQAYDPDILIGWNCINFDLRFLENRCRQLGVTLAIGRHGEAPEWRTSPGNDSHYFTLVPGRAVLDGIDTLKSATYSFESFALEAVARQLLGKGKLIHDPDDRGEEISRLFREDKAALAAYNLEDCKLVWDIFEHTDLLRFAIERARLTGLPLDKVGGSVAAFENQYLPRLHRQGYVAPNLPENPQGVGSPGGYVMDSLPGFYEHVLVLDFKSLYPSIIRSFLVDPYGLTEADRAIAEKDGLDPWALEYDKQRFVKGFRGAYFQREGSILPGLIEQLWKARDVAKAGRHKALQQAIKIIMNSFYGVMGTPGCRFFDPRLPSSITLRGHSIMNQTRQLIEAEGYRVIYGDTDSIFVWLNRQASSDEADTIGTSLTSKVNDWWRQHLLSEYALESALELEYEQHYNRFLMPTIRGSQQGSKKRYAGLVCHRGFSFDSPESDTYELVFKGLESVRTDWTPLARQLQKSLYEKIFLGQPYADLVCDLVAEIKAGEHDEQLVFRKRLRRPLAEYQKNIPPHVQAARKADAWLHSQGRKTRYQRGGWIEYVYTLNGPEPLECQHSALDYDLYLSRQIAPIVDGIVSFLGTSFEALTGAQLSLL